MQKAIQITYMNMLLQHFKLNIVIIQNVLMYLWEVIISVFDQTKTDQLIQNEGNDAQHQP